MYVLKVMLKVKYQYVYFDILMVLYYFNTDIFMG